MSDKKVRIAFSSFPDFSGNSKALYEAIVKRNIKEFELVWLIKDKKVCDTLNEKGIKSFWEKDENFLDEYHKAKIVFLTHDDYINDKIDGQILISLWHGIGPKKSGFALHTQRDEMFIEKFSKAIDFMVAPSEFGLATFAYVFGVDIYSFLIYPQPRYEYLRISDGKKNLSKLLNTDVNKYKKIIMYSPTFRTGLSQINGELSKDNIINIKKYDENNLYEFLKKNNYLLVVKLHPSEESKINIPSDCENIRIIKDADMLNNFITINEVLNAADLLITDYSSIYIDYINLLRPILFINTDIDKYESDRGIIYDSNFWFPGPSVNDYDCLTKEIANLFNDEQYYKKEREDFNRLLNNNAELSNDKIIDEILLSGELFDKDKRTTLRMQNQLLKMEIKKLEEEKDKLIAQNNEIQQQSDKYFKELEAIHYSRSYKMVQKVKKILKKDGKKD